MSTEVKLGISQTRGYENAKLELIKVTTNEQGQKLVSGRELHEVLEIGRDFTTWIKKMIEYGFQENIDYVLLTQTGEQKGRGGHNKIDYILTLEMAKHIAMVQRTEIGMKVRNYFIECEKVAQNPYANLSPELKAIFAIDNKQQELERQQKVIDQRLTNIEENAKLEPGEYSLVAKRVSSRIRQIQEERGWITQAHRSELFKGLNGDILQITGVRHRTQLRQKHLDMVLDFINEWYPSQVTLFNINQMSLGI
ncbi:Phage anti-repressor protein [Turicibacter sanguinis]|nr:Phage anti-repressor protein [Turicibacter sanguinis]